MKTHSIWSKLTLTLAGCALALGATAAEPKKVLLVTVTTAFRHTDSIVTARRILPQLGLESGVFTIVDEAAQPDIKVPEKPKAPTKPKDLAANADEKAKTKYQADLAKFEAAETKYQADLVKWNGPEMQAEVKAAQAASSKALKDSLAKLSPENLKKYDAVIFANTTGDLPLPDQQGFLDWIKAGHAFIGIHSATDTFRGHKPLDPYVLMIGGEFREHGPQVSVTCINQDTNHPACRHLGPVIQVYDEIYQLNGFDRSQVHGLLTLNKHPNNGQPGDYPIAWCKEYGQGKIFYTSLGHREDVWDPNEKNRKNAKEVAEAYQKHILGGIKWALGLEKGDATPGNH